jgi:hypothetical protein
MLMSYKLGENDMAGSTLVGSDRREGLRKEFKNVVCFGREQWALGAGKDISAGGVLVARPAMKIPLGTELELSFMMERKLRAVKAVLVRQDSCGAAFCFSGEVKVA